MPFRICLDKIAKHGLEMKLIDCEYTFDNNKVLFLFYRQTEELISVNSLRILLLSLRRESSYVRLVSAMRQRF